jgi:hypothetical protein
VPEPLIILLLDEDGAESQIAEAVRRAGHRLVTTTGIDTAIVAAGSLMPDLILIRSVSPARDHDATQRLVAIAPEASIRVVSAPLVFATVDPAS